MNTMFGLDADLFSSIAETPEIFESTGRTKFYTVGKRVSFEGTINGIKVPAAMTLESARLTRLSLLEQKSPYNNKSYFLVTGILNPVKMNIEVKIDDEYINIIDVLHNFVNSGTSQITRAQFLETADKIGLKFETGMPLFFQQFGASLEGWTKAREAFVAAGAKDVIGDIEKPGRIKAAYELDNGVEVTGFELGSVNRERSRTKQGFLDLVDASVDQFTRIVRLRKEAAIEDARAAEMQNASQLELKAVQEEAKKLRAMSRQWTTNWSGAQLRMKYEPLDQSVTADANRVYDPVNAPCGRFDMIVNGEKVSVNLWTNSAAAETTVTEPTEAPEPF